METYYDKGSWGFRVIIMLHNLNHITIICFRATLSGMMLLTRLRSQTQMLRIVQVSMMTPGNNSSVITSRVINSLAVNSPGINSSGVNGDSRYWWVSNMSYSPHNVDAGVNKKPNKSYIVSLSIWGILILSVGLNEEFSILPIDTFIQSIRRTLE